MPFPEPGFETRPESDVQCDAGVFDGLQIVEIGQYVAAPIAAELFAHGGADVVKIEPVAGDVTRSTDPLPHQDGSPGADGRQYVVKARGKRALPVDLGTAQGRKIVMEFVRRSDVVITNMRPGTADRLGLGYDQLRIDNPGLVYGEISGFGDSGPNAGRSSFDLIAQAWTGVRLANGVSADGRLAQYEPFYCDYTAGLLLAFGVTAALRHREITGRGQRVATSLAHAGLYLQHRSANLFETVDGWKREMVEHHRGGASLVESAATRAPRVSPDLFFMTTYSTSDGAVSVGAAGAMAATLCSLFDAVDPRSSPEWADRSARPELLDAARRSIAAKVGSVSTEHVLASLHGAGVPASPVRFVEEVLLDPDAHAADLVYETEDPRLGRYIMPSAPLVMSATRYSARRDVAAYGEHTDELLGELGYDEATIDRLVADGVIHRSLGSADDPDYRGGGR